MNRTTDSVAIIVPLRHEQEISHGERVALRHMDHYLGRYDRYYVAPPGSSAPGVGEVVEFPHRFFGSLLTYSQLLMSRSFYKRFSRYEYILIHQLDALAFGDDLLGWCDRGYDYVGAPWIDEPARCIRQGRCEGRVGNGGFSLRRVEAHLRVLQSWRRTPPHHVRRPPADAPLATRLHIRARGWAKTAAFAVGGVHVEVARNMTHEDVWWATRAQHYWPEFQIAPVEEALQFAFEVAPSACYELAGRRLPFGCHAWQTYEPDFWAPYLLPEGK